MNFYKIEDEIEFTDRRQRLIDGMMQQMRGKGYRYMEPVMFEDYDAVVGENSMIEGKPTVKVLSNDGNISILARDLTSGLISAILRRCDADSRLRIMYCGKVFRNTSSGIQEIRKLGAEYLGEDSLSADLEILEMAMDIMSGLSKDYIFEIGSSSFLRNLIKDLGLSLESYLEIMEIIYRKDAFRLGRYISEFEDSQSRRMLENIFSLSGTFEEIMSRMKDLGAGSSLVSSLSQLEETDSFIRQKGLEKNVVYDLSTVSELNYYSGIIFRAYIKDSNGAVIKGGRYRASSPGVNAQMSATGFSVEIDRLTHILV